MPVTARYVSPMVSNSLHVHSTSHYWLIVWAPSCRLASDSGFPHGLLPARARRREAEFGDSHRQKPRTALWSVGQSDEIGTLIGRQTQQRGPDQEAPTPPPPFSLFILPLWPTERCFVLFKSLRMFYVVLSESTAHVLRCPIGINSVFYVLSYQNRCMLRVVLSKSVHVTCCPIKIGACYVLSYQNRCMLRVVLWKSAPFLTFCVFGFDLGTLAVHLQLCFTFLLLFFSLIFPFLKK